MGEGAGGIGLRTDDGAQSWALVLETTGGIDDVCFVDSLTGWAVGNDGTVETTSDGGNTWRDIEVDPYRDFNGVCFVDERNGWIVGDLETIVHTPDAGSTWVWQREGADFSIHAVSFLDSLRGWAAGSFYLGERGVLLKTSDGGESWTQHLELPHSVNNIVFGDSLRGWITGPNAIDWSDDGGESWTPAEIDSLLTVISDVAFADAWTGYAVGFNGRVWETLDGGRTWRFVESFGSGYAFRLFLAIEFSSPYNAWIVGSSGFVGHMRRVPVYE